MMLRYKFTTTGDDNFLCGFPRLGAELFDFLDDADAADDVAKDDVLPVQPVCLLRRNEKLGTVGVGARVGH